MRAQPVPKDTIDLLVTAIYLKRTTVCRCSTNDSWSTLELDVLGQALWDENHASASYAAHHRITAPRYTWQPVAELITPVWTDEQVLQLARTRLYLEELSCHHPAWDDSPARHALDALGDWIAQRMAGHPVEPAPAEPGVIEYAGLSRMPEEWTREIGWRSNLTATAAAFQTPGQRA